MQTDDHFYDPNNQHERMTGTSYRAWPKRLDQVESHDPLASGLWSRLTPRGGTTLTACCNASLIVQRWKTAPQNPCWTAEFAELKDEREECGKVDDAERAGDATRSELDSTDREIACKYCRSLFTLAESKLRIRSLFKREPGAA